MPKIRNGLVSTVIKRSLVISRHKTSVSVEDKVWAALKHIADSQNKTLFKLADEVDKERIKKGHTNLSSALRMHALDWMAEKAGLSEITMEVAR